MEALVCLEIGDPTLELSDSSPIVLSRSHPVPELNSPTAVRVRIYATSLNFANYLQILGKYQEKPPLPFIPGSDFSGIVESVGVRVSRFRVGDKVCSFAALGSFAEMIVADEKDLYCLFSARPAASGFQPCRSGRFAGPWSLLSPGGGEKARLLKSMGVDHVVDFAEDNVTETVRLYLKARGLGGVDVLYDPVGGELTKQSMRLLNWGAKILVIGFASGEVPIIPANIALVKNWTVHGLYWGSYKVHQPKVLEDSLKELLSWLSQGFIKILISHSYALSEANLAFAAIRERKAMGKVMIVLKNNSQPKSKL